MIKDDNFILIPAWAVTKLKLKGNELLIYSIIYGFSQDDKSSFEGSLNYLCEWTNSSKEGVRKSLKSLIDKKLIDKTDIYINGMKLCKYHATKLYGIQ